MPFYAIGDLAAICNTTPAVIREAATVMNKREMAGMLTWRPSIPLAFIEEVHRIRDMHRRAEQRRERGLENTLPR